MMSGESDDPEALLVRIKSEIEKARRDGLSKADFEREKRCHYSSYVADFDSTEDIAFCLTSYAADKMELFEYPDIVSSITLEYLTELLNNGFAEEAYTLSVIRPK